MSRSQSFEPQLSSIFRIMFGSNTHPYYTDDLTDHLKASYLNYTVTTGKATSGIDLTQRESHVQESRDNNKKVGRKQKIDAGGSGKPEI